MKKTITFIAILFAFAFSMGGAFLITKVLKGNISIDVPLLATISDIITDVSRGPKEDESVDSPKEIISEKPTENEASDESKDSETTGKSTERSPTEQVTGPQIEKMTPKDFEQLLISGNVNKNKHIATFVNIRTSGKNENDRPIDNGDLMGVSQKILNEQWKSVRVISVGYDGRNRINSVVIKPVYPEVQEKNQPFEELQTPQPSEERSE